MPTRGAFAAPSAPRQLGRPIGGLFGTALLGAGGSALLALASDLPASPFGPHAGGLWPFAGAGAAPSWEGPATPRPGRRPRAVPGWGRGICWSWRLHSSASCSWWSRGSVSGPSYGPIQTLVPQTCGGSFLRGPRRCCSLPLCQPGRLGLRRPGQGCGLGAGTRRPRSISSGHSVWLSGVDPRYLTGLVDLRARCPRSLCLFATVSGGHPWIAVECWRLAVIAAWCCAPGASPESPPLAAPTRSRRWSPACQSRRAPRLRRRYPQRRRHDRTRCGRIALAVTKPTVVGALGRRPRRHA